MDEDFEKMAYKALDGYEWESVTYQVIDGNFKAALAIVDAMLIGMYNLPQEIRSTNTWSIAQRLANTVRNNIFFSIPEDERPSNNVG